MEPHEKTSEWDSLLVRYQMVRQKTEELVAPLVIEDYGVQTMADVSPPKWHLSHTTWFFETFVLAPTGVPQFHPHYRYLFNSYYETVGQFWPRNQRGWLSRPTVAEVFVYRHAVDERIEKMLRGLSSEDFRDILPTVVLGLNHEQQHQELLLTDILYNFSVNPLKPLYRETRLGDKSPPPEAQWISFAGGLQPIGYDGRGFCFDNETPRHQEWLDPYQLQDRLVTNEEFLAFMTDGGYENPALWLSAGWQMVQEFGWKAPLYWSFEDGEWCEFSLGGMRPISWNGPVQHVSYFEADAYARWAGARLPRESEWEVAAGSVSVDEGTFLDSRRLTPNAVKGATDGRLRQMFGELWQWTQSSYSPYPGYYPTSGALGEYNGKFMSGQQVLRGGSCVTPADHIRPTYRNFFPPNARWQFSGIRLARDAHD